ncbi:MAG: SMP-30/gluconolactonase/LRE family protein [Pseudomonadota bacterium]
MDEALGRLSLENIEWVGHSLVRPECAVTHQTGYVFAPDWTGPGGVSVIAPDGTVFRHLAHSSFFRVRPNGIVLEPSGTILLAHLGDETGGIFRLHPDGGVEPVLVSVEGKPLPPTNFIYREVDGSLWVTVSTRKSPRALGYRPDVDDGFIVRVDSKEATIAAEGLGYTNECIRHPERNELWVNETFGRRLTAFEIIGNRLSSRRTICSFADGDYPDGLAFDADGCAWVTSIVSNRLYRITPNGKKELVLEDVPGEKINEVETAFQAGEMARPHLDTPFGAVLKNISNLAFGGPDMRTAYLGCLLGDRMASVKCPIPGAPMPSYTVDISPLLGSLGTKAVEEQKGNVEQSNLSDRCLSR